MSTLSAHCTAYCAINSWYEIIFSFHFELDCMRLKSAHFGKILQEYYQGLRASAGGENILQ